MKLPITGPMYQHASQDVSFQKCINMFLADAGPNGRGENGVLLHSPGLKSLGNVSGKSEVRAVINYQDEKLYCVIDDTAYVITFDEDALSMTFASMGTLNTSTGPVSWAINPTQVMLVDGSSSGYIITVSSDTIADIADADFTGGDTVVFMDSYFLYNTPDASTMFATAQNDGTNITATDVATAEGHPDEILALKVFKNELWVFGQVSIEIWWDEANATGFPFSKRVSASMDLGCGAAHSVQVVDNGLCWLDNRGYVVYTPSYAKPGIISTPAINQEIQNMETISDAIAFTYTDRGGMFYQITFPTEEKTFVYDFITQTWHEKAYWTQDDAFTRHKVNSHVRYKNWELVGGYNDGTIYILDAKTYTDGGDPIHRVRTTAHINDEFRLLTIYDLELHLESGKGLVTGTGSDPQIMMRYSNDGGFTYSNELARSIGKIGEYSKRVRWNALGAAREWLFEFRFTDPIPFTIVDASISAESGE